MLWLHGGGFHVGSSSDPMTDGKALAQKGDVVIVSVNHRLNILGFLDLSEANPKYAQSANVGMLDVVKALEWVKNNIENFGGDPSNVTIFGESGGGGKVGTLMCMPSAKGSLQASQADIDLTKKLRDGGKLVDIQILDHIIMTSESYYSFADEGLL